jgi:hypothetical protein
MPPALPEIPADEAWRYQDDVVLAAELPATIGPAAIYSFQSRGFFMRGTRCTASANLPA